METKKCVLIGSGGCGKTAFLHKALTGEFEKRYIATLGVEVMPARVEGQGVLNVWDCAGQEKFGGLRQGYYVGTDVAIVMFDVSSNLSFQEGLYAAAEFQVVCPRARLVFVANKHELASPGVMLKAQKVSATHELHFISTKLASQGDVMAILATLI